MKRLLISAGVVLALLGGGLSWSLRRQPSAAPLDDQASAFTVQASGPGRLITFQAAQIPLRSLRWLAPLPGGVVAAQVLSQNDRQRVALFRDGLAQETLLVLKPVGVSDGFWRFAALREAAAPSGTLLLLYQPGDPGSTEASLVLALDVASQQVRWFIRGDFNRLVLTPDAQAVYLYGGKGPIQRIALNQATAHPAPTTIDLPAEIPQVEQLLPTGASGFLASHRSGLSCYRVKEGWTHFPLPEARGVDCPNFRSGLARAGKDIWWQAVPGQLVKVHADGSPGPAWQGELPEADPFAKDARLLSMLGADPSGNLWFALATPGPQAAKPSAETPAETDTAAVPADDWGAYATAGLDRLYRLNPGRSTLQRITLPALWSALRPPPTVQPPTLGQGVVPAAGALLAEGVRCAWWLPLDSLGQAM
jgi:hypothetical protein